MALALTFRRYLPFFGGVAGRRTVSVTVVAG
jgi:hypothetical protein